MRQQRLLITLDIGLLPTDFQHQQPIALMLDELFAIDRDMKLLTTVTLVEITLTLAHDCVGTGPRLQMLTSDPNANRFVEQEFMAWSDAVGFAEKLRTMRLARVSDGESFGLLTSNPVVESPVQLDLKLVEADQVTSTILSRDQTRYIDGIRFMSMATRSRTMCSVNIRAMMFT